MTEQIIHGVRYTDYFAPDEVDTPEKVEKLREFYFGKAGRLQTTTQIGPMNDKGLVQVTWSVPYGGEA